MFYAKKINLETGQVKAIYIYKRIEEKNINLDSSRGFFLIDQKEYLSLRQELLTREEPLSQNSNSAERDEVIDLENDEETL